MKVFISWSGDASRELGEAIRDWLPSVIQSVKPFFTPNDIEKGARWSKDIANELEESSIGIFCLTSENLSKPWIMFEAGALSKRLDISRVCPILFGIENTDLQGPLVQFQSSKFSREEMLKLLKTINSCLGENKLDMAILDGVFEMWWPKLEERVNKILLRYNGVEKNKDIRNDRELLEEILQLTRLKSNSVNEKRHPLIEYNSYRHLVDRLDELVDSLADNCSLLEAREIVCTFYKPLINIARNIDLPEEQKRNLIQSIEDVNFLSIQ